jgi:hypothetical protein
MTPPCGPHIWPAPGPKSDAKVPTPPLPVLTGPGGSLGPVTGAVADDFGWMLGGG